MSDERIELMILQTRHIDSISGVSAELLNAFPPERYRVTLVYLEAGRPSQHDQRADRCVFLGLEKGDYKGLRLKALRRLRAFLRENAFDVVIANMYKPVNLLLQLRRHLRASVCIGIIHGFGEFDRPLRRWMIRRLLEPRWHLVGVSEPVRQYLMRAGCGLHEDNTSAIPNAVDVRRLGETALVRESARRALDIPASAFVVGTLGRCVADKGQLDLLAGFALFAAGRPEARLVIIGDGPLLATLSERARRLGVAGQVVLPGHLPEGWRYLSALDVFAFPSQREGFGLALVEAMALGLPCVVNDRAPLTDLVAGVGRALDTRNTPELAECLEQWRQLAPEQRRSLGQAHRDQALRDYDVAVFRCAYRQLVERELGKVSPKPVS